MSNLQNNKNSNNRNTNKMYVNNAPKYTIQTGYTGSKVFGIILLLVIVLVLAYASNWLYTYYSTKQFIKPQEVEVMPDVKNASSKFNVSSGSIPNSNYSNEYSMSCWINIADYTYNYGKEKVIMRRGEAGSGNPEIVLGAKTNDLIVRLKLQGDENTVSEFQDIHIPLQNDIEGKNYENFKNTNPDTISFNNNNNNNNNYKELLKHKIGDNDVDFPTIQYISNNEDDNNKFFSMISGNTLNDTIVENFEDHDATEDPTHTEEPKANEANEAKANEANEANKANEDPSPTEHSEHIYSEDSYNSDTTVGHCIVKMIPLQKWVNIIVSVYNQVVDIYIDGQLASSCVLKRFPKINTNDVEITPDGGFSGMISRVTFTNAAMTIQQAKSIYYAGPIFSESLFSIIPEWVYWGILILIILSIGFSFM